MVGRGITQKPTQPNSESMPSYLYKSGTDQAPKYGNSEMNTQDNYVHKSRKLKDNPDKKKSINNLKQLTIIADPY